jgi:hypothetical protein
MCVLWREFWGLQVFGIKIRMLQAPTVKAVTNPERVKYLIKVLTSVVA